MTSARMIWMAAGALALYGAVRALPLVPCWGAFVLAAAVAWPIWRAHAEASIFVRRAVLEGVTHGESRVRRWFWAGNLSSIVHAIVAVAWAVGLLAFAATLSAAHWVVVAVDVALLALAGARIERYLARDVRSGQEALVARRWPLLLGNVAFLAIAFMAVDFFWAGAIDTRELAWHEVAERAYFQASAAAACPGAGAALGAVAVIDQLTWHAAQVLIPGLPGPAMRIAAWVLVLLQAGVVGYAITRLLLGMAIASERATARSVAAQTPSRVFLLTMAGVGLALLAGAWMMRDYDSRALASRARHAVSWANPCRPDPQAVATLEGALGTTLQRARSEARALADARSEAAVAEIFVNVEGGVDRYLDWYFTVIGEYQRLGALATGDFAGLVSRQLEQQLFGEGAAFGERVEAVARVIDAEVEGKMSKAASEMQARAREGLRTQPCRFERVNFAALGNLKRDRLRAATAAGAGLAGGMAVRLLAARAAASVAARAAGRRSFQVAARVGGNVVARRAGSITLSAAGAAAACAPGGPLAVICAIGAGMVVWLATDQAFIMIDEALFRGDMRKELLVAVGEEQAALLAALKAREAAAIDAMAAEIHASVQRAFVPARQGI